MSLNNGKVAIVTDWLLAPGGADRLLESLLRFFTQADIYTAAYNQHRYKDSIISDFSVKTTFIDSRFLKSMGRGINILSPIAFEQLDLSEYDTVVTLSAGSAKGVITRLNQKHISIVLTPPRVIWSNELPSRTISQRLKSQLYYLTINRYMRAWDFTAAHRADKVLSISKYISDQVREFYDLESEVIYPGVSAFWQEETIEDGESDAFLIVSRLHEYKKIDSAIRAAIKTDSRLDIVGDGPDYRALKALAGSSKKIKFWGYLDDLEVRSMYKKAKAVIFPGIEDFGYVPIEAMMQGTPVIAFGIGGVTETVVDQQSGIIYDSEDGLISAMYDFDKRSFDRDSVRTQALKFTEDRFIKQFKKLLNG